MCSFSQAHVYHLMKSDSYSRYLRSEMYKEILNGSKKKVTVILVCLAVIAPYIAVLDIREGN